MNRKDLQALTLVGIPRYNPELNPLAVLHLDKLTIYFNLIPICFRTSREKEEWFNRFLVSAKFMEDWEHQNPKDHTKVNPSYETQKVKQQKFNIFLEDYFQVKITANTAFV